MELEKLRVSRLKHSVIPLKQNGLQSEIRIWHQRTEFTTGEITKGIELQIIESKEVFELRRDVPFEPLRRIEDRLLSKTHM